MSAWPLPDSQVSTKSHQSNKAPASGHPGTPCETTAFLNQLHAKNNGSLDLDNDPMKRRRQSNSTD